MSCGDTSDELMPAVRRFCAGCVAVLAVGGWLAWQVLR